MEDTMKPRSLCFGLLTIAFLVIGVSVYAQVSRPYRNGTVWQIAFIRVTPGMDEAYRDYVATKWKTNQEAAKQEKLILSYKVLTTEAHSPDDWNMLLMTEYRDLASMEANEQKQEALFQRMIGDDSKQQQGYRDRAEMRQVMGSRLARELVLEAR
jgi:hypothetical protein